MSATEFRKTFAREYLDDTRRMIDALEKEFQLNLDNIAEVLIRARKERNNIFIMGNGGSASTASHFACDLSKGAMVDGIPRIKAIALTDNVASMLAWANDLDYGEIFIEQLRSLMEPGDVVIGISGSGNSMNVVKAIQYANEHGATTIGLSGFDGGTLIKCAKYNIHVPSFSMERAEDMHLIVNHLLTCLMREEGKREIHDQSK